MFLAVCRMNHFGRMRHKYVDTIQILPPKVIAERTPLFLFICRANILASPEHPKICTKQYEAAVAVFSLVMYI